MNIQEILSEYQEHKKIARNEGSTGFENLCRLVRGLGYRDSMYRMQFRDGCVGDLIEFLEDNPGCIETIKEWIGDHGCQDWHDSLESELPARKNVKDCYPEGVCPDCGTDIPDDTVEGEECENGNCGHVFVAEHEDDDICGECAGPLKSFMKESGTSLEEVFGCPNCD
jgi:ribosomal protein S27AE